jgi:uncharacterized protein (DUF1015 family)
MYWPKYWALKTSVPIRRIDFVGGIRGLGELEKRVNSGEMVVAFQLIPGFYQAII